MKCSDQDCGCPQQMIRSCLKKAKEGSQIHFYLAKLGVEILEQRKERSRNR